MELVNRTLADCLSETAEKYPANIALEQTDWTCTFRELDEITDAYAGRLMYSYGVKKGQHIGIWSVNTPSFVFTVLALAKIGAVVCVFNTYYRVEEMSRILRQSDVELLFYGSGCKDTVYDDLIPEIRRRTPSVKHFYHIDEKEGGIWMSLDSFSHEEKSPERMQRVTEAKRQVTAQDPVFIIFTSGTTETPKGVVLTHYNVVNDALHTQHYMRWTEDDKMCVSAPMFHCFGLITALALSSSIVDSSPFSTSGRRASLTSSASPTASLSTSPAATYSMTEVEQPHSGWMRKSAPGWAARVAAMSDGRMPAWTWHSSIGVVW